MNLPKVFKNSVKLGEPLAPHTTFKIGGRAIAWFEPKNKKELISFLRRKDISLPIFVIGSGSNLLINDGEIVKVFMHLSGADFNAIKIDKNILDIGAGVKIGSLISFLSSKNFCGYEFLAGIPGTIGGAIVMNAGARSDVDKLDSYREMKDIVEEIEVLDRHGNLLKISKDDCGFGYRQTNLRGFIILSAKLRLLREDKKNVQERIKKLLKKRIEVQDWNFPSAGSFFKNPKDAQSAGKLIDLCHLKGTRFGDAQVSLKHANFIINVGDAKCRDVIKLMEIVKEKVYNRFKIILEPEVEIVR